MTICSQNCQIVNPEDVLDFFKKNLNRSDNIQGQKTAPTEPVIKNKNTYFATPKITNKQNWFSTTNSN